MKKSTRLIFLFILLSVALAWPGTALAKSIDEDKVIFGDSYTLKNGETLNGNLVILGGNAVLEDGSQLNGDLILMGGNMNSAGRINGNLVIFGGNGSLGNTAVVKGNVSTFGGNLDRAPGAVIEGEVNPGRDRTPPFVPPVFQGRGVDTFSPFRVFLNLIWFLFRTFMWAALAVLVIMFLPLQVERTAQAAVTAPIISGGVGLLTAFAAPIVMIILAITILLIPVSLLVAFLLVIAWAFGLVSLGYAVGRRLAEALNQTWVPAAAAGIGTFVLMFIVDGISTAFRTAGYVIPGIACLNWILPFLVGIIGLGAVLLTRFGTTGYPPHLVSLRGDWPPSSPAGPAATAVSPSVTTPAPFAGDYPPPVDEAPPSSRIGVYPAPLVDEEQPPAEEDRPLEP